MVGVIKGNGKRDWALRLGGSCDYTCVAEDKRKACRQTRAGR